MPSQSTRKAVTAISGGRKRKGATTSIDSSDEPESKAKKVKEEEESDEGHVSDAGDDPETTDGKGVN